MTQVRIPAAFIRGGTSKGVFFHERHLPKDRMARDRIFLEAIGSPDPYGRQLNGMGGGVSSVSKVVIIAPSKRDDADIDYTFVQIGVTEPVVDYDSMCGNLSSAVGPFAVDEGLVPATEGEALVRVFNTNTKKVYHARFPVAGGQAVVTGNQAIPGVAGFGARVALEYFDPAGSRTVGLFPTGRVRETLDLPDGTSVDATLIDATNPIVIVAAADFGLDVTERPEAIEARTQICERLEMARRLAGVRMGMAETAAAVPMSVPKIVAVASPRDFEDLSGVRHPADSVDIVARAVSMGQVHRALPLTLSMCLASACRIEGTIAQSFARRTAAEADVRLGNPSGVIAAGATVERSDAPGGWSVPVCRVVRTQRRLMEGHVCVPMLPVG
ncbi:MAG: PrpF family protein [Hyphomicrobiaceae bacterium]|nr:PrpF family protein [Hyphomicrobiaceae bacterium]